MQKHGFTLVRDERLVETSGPVRLWRHEATGAEVLSVVNADENKCFGVSFRTPPADSTGVPHILEHSVLCGSEKYPVKEPFVELLKGSLQTFLNAFTFPDKTCYPVASTNLRDFYNLIDVYLDAVFFPLIPETVFQQEGHHVETEGPDAPLSFKGVVYNEMKGVYSSPDSVLAEQSQQAVFPDMTYGLDSGGNPACIPDLTYAAFKDFHTRLYHPSNARFFFWGDDPEEARLELLAPYLERFSRRDVRSAVPLQPRLPGPRCVEVPFAAPEGEARGHVTVNWLLCESSDIEELFCLEMLEHILQGLPGSPLRRALIESGLGEDLAGGLETELRQAFYSVGLRSIVPGTAGEVETLILDTLRDLADKGVPELAVEAALNSLEFDLRENNTGSFPRGLSAMLRSLTTWLHDGDPLAPLAWQKPLEAVKARLERREKVFETLIRRRFLDNPHRVRVTLVPDPELAARREAAEAARLERLAASLTPAGREELAAQTRRLIEIQQTPDSPEALATIPSLTTADLPRENTRIPSRADRAGKLETWNHDLDTSGILYATLALPLDGVPLDLMPLVPLFARSLTEMGTSRHDFAELGALTASRTGGIEAAPLFLSRRADRAPIARLLVSGKATADKLPDFFELLSEILLETRFDDPERFMQMVLEERARCEQSLIPGGHAVVSTRLCAAHSAAGRLNELTGGVTYLERLRGLEERLRTDPEAVRTDLETLRRLVMRRSGTVLDLTADAATLGRAAATAADLGEALPDVGIPDADRIFAPLPEGDEALLVPAQVNYVGKGANLYDLGWKEHGSAHVVARRLRMAWLWDQVRVQGGAYGAFCSLDRITGGLTQVSYRDPNVEKTLAAYDAGAAWLRDAHLSDRELDLAVVGAIGDLDAYKLPDAKGRTALLRRLIGDDEAGLQQLREEMLGTSRKDFARFADALDEAARAGRVCVLGGPAAEAAAENHGWKVTRLL